MSKKIGLECPKCGSTLFVKRALHRIANHPLYAKKGRLVINYSHSVHTEHREQKLWLRCLNCDYIKLFEVEQDLRTYVGALLYDQLEKVYTVPKKSKPAKNTTEESLPVIVQPSQMDLEDESV